MIDKAKLMNSFANDEEILIAVSEEFVTQLPQELQKVKVQIEGADLDGLKITAHTLKGLAGTFCSDNAREVAAKMEKAAEQKDKELVTSIQDSFEKEFDNLLTDVKVIIEGSK